MTKIALIVGLVAAMTALPATAQGAEDERWSVSRNALHPEVTMLHAEADGILVEMDEYSARTRQPELRVICTSGWLRVVIWGGNFDTAEAFIISQNGDSRSLGAIREIEDGWATATEISPIDLINGGLLLVSVSGIAPFGQTVTWDLEPAALSLIEHRKQCIRHGI